jgi:hypothetical protein
MRNPYSSLGKSAFWRTAVAERESLRFKGIYTKKFDLSPEDRIVTAGSCFAQHIARHLKKSGFNFCDYERAPHYLHPKHAPKFNFGVYSARYCNIYTVRQLLQTFERAFGERQPSERAWPLNNGVVDPFRPALEPVPFVNEDEMLASRATHLRAARQVFEECDLFVFTLGLTEGWVSRQDGSVFPLCPGTSGGIYDTSKYEFHNFTFAEIYADMLLFIQKLRAVNPGVRMLFTVSPVPLTATASGNHVLAATTYSKSVLRAVAGEIAAQDESIDYFPSYELIAAPPIKGRFFEANMREVKQKGVRYVMSHFFAQHAPDKQAEKRQRKHGAKHKSKAEKRMARELKADGVICEEYLLEKHA